MKYTWTKTGIGKIDNLGKQMEKVFRGANQGALETRYRYAEGSKRFISHVAQKYGLQRLQNVQDKHLESYVRELQARNCSDKYIKNELAAVRYMHSQIPQAKFELTESTAFNRAVGLGSTPDGRCDRGWTDREVSSMRSLCKEMDRSDLVKALDLTRSTGMRLDEVCTLKRNEVEQALKSGRLHLTNTKGGRPRDVELTGKSRDVLERAIKDVERGGYVVAPKEFWNGKIHIYEANAEKFLYDHRDKIQDKDRNVSAHNVKADERAPLTWHGLRHTYAREELQRLVDSGMTPKEARQTVAEELGHWRSSVTNIYLSGGGDC